MHRLRFPRIHNIAKWFFLLVLGVCLHWAGPHWAGPYWMGDAFAQSQDLPATSAVTSAIQPYYIQDCPDCPKLAVIPAQRMRLGMDAGRKGETPSYEAVLKAPIAMSITEVTFDQWQVCVDDGVCPAIENDNGWGRGQRPVMRIKWADANVFADWLSKRTGQVYRLPTEDEWEIAARAGSEQRYSWGAKMQPGQAHCRHCEKTDLSNLQDKGTHETIPVASHAPNPYGLYDMVGNVWEWTADCWRPSHDAPRGGPSCTHHSVRGGSWYFFGFVGGSPARAAQYTDQGSYDVGIRLVRDLSMEEVVTLPKEFWLIP